MDVIGVSEDPYEGAKDPDRNARSFNRHIVA